MITIWVCSAAVTDVQKVMLLFEFQVYVSWYEDWEDERNQGDQSADD